MQYEIRRGVLGTSVIYVCPQCKGLLKSKLEEAGNQDRCPDCGADFNIPGTKEKIAESAAVEAEIENRRREAETQAQQLQQQRIHREQNRARDQRIRAEQQRADDRLARGKAHYADIPKYDAIKIWAAISNIIGGLCIFLGVVVVVLVAANRERIAEGLIGFVILDFIGLAYFVLAQTLDAFRDIAINSWYTRYNTLPDDDD